MLTKQKLAVLADISEDLAQLILDEVKQSAADDLHDLYDSLYGCPEEQSGISAAASKLKTEWWD